MPRKDKYSQQRLDNIARCQSKKNARRKRKKAANKAKAKKS